MLFTKICSDRVFKRLNVLGAEECVNNLRAATLKPAFKIETVECNLH